MAPSFTPLPGTQAVGALLPSVAYTLDGMTGIYGGWGLHRLRKAYTGAPIRVQNDAGAQADIPFNISGELDQIALLLHTGSGNGYVVTLYDQGPTGRHLSNAVYASAAGITDGSSSPKIVTAGVVEKIANRPALYFNGSNILESSTSAMPTEVAAVMLDRPDIQSTSGFQLGWYHSASPSYNIFGRVGSSSTARWSYSPSGGGTAGLIEIANGSPAETPNVLSLRDDATVARLSRNGAQIGSRSFSKGGTAPNKLQMGGRHQSGSSLQTGYQGRISAVVLFNVNQEITAPIADFMLRGNLYPL